MLLRHINASGNVEFVDTGVDYNNVRQHYKDNKYNDIKASEVNG